MSAWIQIVLSVVALLALLVAAWTLTAQSLRERRERLAAKTMARTPVRRIEKARKDAGERWKDADRDRLVSEVNARRKSNGGTP